MLKHTLTNIFDTFGLIIGTVCVLLLLAVLQDFFSALSHECESALRAREVSAQVSAQVFSLICGKVGCVPFNLSVVKEEFKAFHQTTGKSSAVHLQIHVLHCFLCYAILTVNQK